MLAFDAETLALKPPAMRNARGGVAALAAARRTRTLDSSPRATNDDDDDDGGETFSVFVAGDDAASVVSRHLFDASRRDETNQRVSLDEQNASKASLETQTALSAASLVRTASEPISVLRDAHAPTQTQKARLKRHSDAADADSGGVLAATLGVAVHPAGHVVVTCGADGTLLVSPANAFADPTERIGLESFGGSASASESGNVSDAEKDFAQKHAQRFVGAHAGAARGVTFLPTDDPAGDSLLATVGEGRVLCVWDVHAAALGALEKNRQTVADKKKGKSLSGAFAATSRARAFGLAPTPTSVDAESVSSHTKTQTSRSSFPSQKSLGETRAARAAPTSAGYARAPPEPWAEPSSSKKSPSSENERENAEKKISAAFPSRVVGLAVGASAASAERTENAAAVAAAAAAPGALYVPELGALAYAAGAEVVIERVGSAKTQAVLRDPFRRRFGDALPQSAPMGATSRPTITALARHADSRRLASASPCRGPKKSADDATIRVWDSGTGALLFTATHDACGGAVSALAFSPNGERLLSLGGDPDGAVRAFSVPTFRSDETEKKPVKTLVPVLALSTSEPVASGAWLSPDAFFVVGAGGATAYAFVPSENENETDDFKKSVRAFPFRFEDGEDGDALDPAPVCTAAAALERDGCVYAEAFAGDSRGRVWACTTTSAAFFLRGGEKNTCKSDVDVSAVARRERERFARRAPSRRSRDDSGGVHGRHRVRRLRRLSTARARAVFGAPASRSRRKEKQKKRAVLVRARRARARRRGDVESRDDVRFRFRRRRNRRDSCGSHAREARDGDHERGHGVGGGHAHGKREGSFVRACRRRRRRDVAFFWRRARHCDYRRRRARLGDTHVRESAGGFSGRTGRAEMRDVGAVRRALRARARRRDGARHRLRIARRVFAYERRYRRETDRVDGKKESSYLYRREEWFRRRRGFRFVRVRRAPRRRSDRGGGVRGVPAGPKRSERADPAGLRGDGRLRRGDGVFPRPRRRFPRRRPLVFRRRFDHDFDSNEDDDGRARRTGRRAPRARRGVRGRRLPRPRRRRARRRRESIQSAKNRERRRLRTKKTLQTRRRVSPRR